MKPKQIVLSFVWKLDGSRCFAFDPNSNLITSPAWADDEAGAVAAWVKELDSLSPYLSKRWQ